MLAVSSVLHPQAILPLLVVGSSVSYAMIALVLGDWNWPAAGAPRPGTFRAFVRAVWLHPIFGVVKLFLAAGTAASIVALYLQVTSDEDQRTRDLVSEEHAESRALIRDADERLRRIEKALNVRTIDIRDVESESEGLRGDLDVLEAVREKVQNPALLAELSELIGRGKSRLRETEQIKEPKPLGERLEPILVVLEGLAPESARELRRSLEAGELSIGELTLPGHAVAALDQGTILLRAEDRTNLDIAVVLLHEWRHVQSFRDVPDNPLPRFGPLEHAAVYLSDAETLAEYLQRTGPSEEACPLLRKSLQQVAQMLRMAGAAQAEHPELEARLAQLQESLDGLCPP